MDEQEPSRQGSPHRYHYEQHSACGMWLSKTEQGLNYSLFHTEFPFALTKHPGISTPFDVSWY
jgi:hypothetical protein